MVEAIYPACADVLAARQKVVPHSDRLCGPAHPQSAVRSTISSLQSSPYIAACCITDACRSLLCSPSRVLLLSTSCLVLSRARSCVVGGSLHSCRTPPDCMPAGSITQTENSSSWTWAKSSGTSRCRCSHCAKSAAAAYNSLWTPQMAIA